MDAHIKAFFIFPKSLYTKRQYGCELLNMK